MNVDAPSRAIADHSYQIGEFILCPAQRRLERSGKTIAVGARAFDVLLALARHPNEFVAIPELKRAVWGDLHVEDVAVRFQILSLRKILGNSCISSAAGKGYRLSTRLVGTACAAGGLQDLYREKLRRLPQIPHRVIGRDETIEQIRSKLDSKRFVSIVGPGGVGKTTLAFAVGKEAMAAFEDAVCFVDLSPLADPALVGSAIASALGLAVSTSDPQSQVVNFLRDKAILVVLDNCEHVIDRVAAIAEAMFAGGPKVHILATSREPLRVQGEHVVSVRPLKVPEATLAMDSAKIAEYPAVELFLERASAAEGVGALTLENATVVAEICRKLDGLPLAIELAAARCDAYTLSALNSALDEQVKMDWRGRRTAPDRHQTLDGLIGWSFALLDDTDRAILLALSVFQGPFRLSAAEVVAGPLSSGLDEFHESFHKLVSHSLVSVDLSEHEPRYRLLDTTRTYAALRFDQADFKLATKRRHLNWLIDTSNKAEAAWGDMSAQSWLEAFGVLIDDVRAGIDWAFSVEEEVRQGIRLVTASSALWFRLSLTNEYRNRLLRAQSCLDRQPEDMPRERMQLNIAMGFATWHTSGAPKTMSEYFGRGAELAEILQDRQNLRLALWGLWRAASNTGDERAALRLAERHGSLIDQSADRHDYLVHLRMKALSLHLLGRQQEAGVLAREILQGHASDTRESSAVLFDPRVACETLISRVHWLEGKPIQAARLAESCFDLASRKRHLLSMCYSLAIGLCPVSLWNGDFAAARFYAERLLAITSDYGYPYWENFAARYLGLLAHIEGEAEPGRNSRDRCTHHNPYIDDFMATVCPESLPADVMARLNEKLDGWCRPELIRVRANNETDKDEKARLFEQSLALSRAQGALSWELRTATSYAIFLAERSRRDRARDILASAYAKFTEGFETRDLVEADRVLRSL